MQRGKSSLKRCEGSLSSVGSLNRPRSGESFIIEGKLFSIFDDGSIEIQTGSGIKQFKDFAELRAVAAANGQEGTGRTEPGRHSLQHPTLHDLVPH